ncbi:hypothetical protein HanRHA438_Chr09g0383561 [Helianthus annuus]|nr:hypothetical protein HanHA89_Chr09g0325901 [Helianthus annuus]KAJ0706299.1 hypothetical protein HanLR1_Chr09g0305401 [Helianthus annuus]KAJ0886802.1 hypothetical protein HanRHA438_Chr09g0383561 [Helianthus annuus]
MNFVISIGSGSFSITLSRDFSLTGSSTISGIASTVFLPLSIITTAGSDSTAFLAALSAAFLAISAALASTILKNSASRPCFFQYNLIKYNLKYVFGDLCFKNDLLSFLSSSKSFVTFRNFILPFVSVKRSYSIVSILGNG